MNAPADYIESFDEQKISCKRELETALIKFYVDEECWELIEFLQNHRNFILTHHLKSFANYRPQNIGSATSDINTIDLWIHEIWGTLGAFNTWEYNKLVWLYDRLILWLEDAHNREMWSNEGVRKSLLFVQGAIISELRLQIDTLFTFPSLPTSDVWISVRQLLITS